MPFIEKQLGTHDQNTCLIISVLSALCDSFSFVQLQGHRCINSWAFPKGFLQQIVFSAALLLESLKRIQMRKSNMEFAPLH